MKKYHFYSDWFGWPCHDMEALTELCGNSIDITRRTFLKHVEGMPEIEQNLGYESHHSKGLVMSADWHVSYHRGKLHGHTAYYFRHSGIEHVFTSAEDFTHASGTMHLTASCRR